MNEEAVHNPDENAWVLPALWGAILLGSTAAAFWALRTPPPVYSAPPLPAEPPPPPSEYEAAVLAVTSDPDGDPKLLATQAFHASHPECPGTPESGGAACVEAFLRVQGYVNDLLKPPPPVEKQSLPNQCDPLATPPPGMVCVQSGGVWVLRLEQKILQASFLEETEANQIRFAADYEEAEIGPAWQIHTLDVWLEQQRKAGYLKTYGDNKIIVAGVPAYQWETLDWPGAEGTYNVMFGHPDTWVRFPYEASAARAIRQFAEAAFVITPSGSVRIIDLPLTLATQQLRNAIVSYVAGFQNRTFED